jgi:Spy/CpxP family protein refolding chaperone
VNGNPMEARETMTRTGWFTTTTVAAVMAVGAIGVAAQTAQDGQAPPTRQERGLRGHDGFGPGFGGFRGRGGPGGPGGLELPLRALDLSEAQREQVQTIMQGYRDEFQATRQKLAAARKAQHDAVTAVPANESLIRARVAESSAVETEAALLRAKVHGEVWAVLTPEQQAKATAFKAEREKRMAERRQRLQERRQQRQQQRQQARPQA